MTPPSYTIAALAEELVETAERRARARLPSHPLKAYYDREGHRHLWLRYEKFAGVPDVEPDPDDTQAIAKYAVKLLLRALLDGGGQAQ